MLNAFCTTTTAPRVASELQVAACLALPVAWHLSWATMAIHSRTFKACVRRSRSIALAAGEVSSELQVAATRTGPIPRFGVPRLPWHPHTRGIFRSDRPALSAIAVARELQVPAALAGPVSRHLSRHCPLGNAAAGHHFRHRSRRRTLPALIVSCKLQVTTVRAIPIAWLRAETHRWAHRRTKARAVTVFRLDGSAPATSSVLRKLNIPTIWTTPITRLGPWASRLQQSAGLGKVWPPSAALPASNIFGELYVTTIRTRPVSRLCVDAAYPCVKSWGLRRGTTSTASVLRELQVTTIWTVPVARLAWIACSTRSLMRRQGHGLGGTTSTAIEAKRELKVAAIGTVPLTRSARRRVWPRSCSCAAGRPSLSLGHWRFRGPTQPTIHAQRELQVATVRAVPLTRSTVAAATMYTSATSPA